MKILALASFVFLLFGVKSQDNNAGGSVAKYLWECYNETIRYNREYRPPATINVLIDLIRKIESGPSRQDARQFSLELLHRFRQDGILKISTSSRSVMTLPFAPRGMQHYKNKILLTKLVPGNAVMFPNETLNSIERCSLHFILSNSVDSTERGDETSTCNRVARYERRLRRDANLNDEVELIDDSYMKSMKGNMQDAGDNDYDIPPTESDVSFIPPQPQPRGGDTISQCPIENGAVYTRWGAIQAGTVIAGIATGLTPLKYKYGNMNIDNTFAATLAGDLSEVSLHQAVNADNMLIGDRGAWNSTLVPRWYFLERNTDWQMTDAEIRAGLDGLIMAKNIEKWQKQASSLKISQILDMYYSNKGVFSKEYRACKRNILLTEVAPTETLIKETEAFNYILAPESMLPIIDPANYNELATNAVTNFFKYVSSLNDLQCEAEDVVTVRAATDIYIVLDFSWPYETVQPIVAYLLESLDVNRYGSNFTIINARNGMIVVNSSQSILDFYQLYNQTIHTENPTGIDYSNVLNQAEDMVKSKMDNDKYNSVVGGRSTIAVFIPYTERLSGSDEDAASNKKGYFRNNLPDLKLLVLGPGSKDAYSKLVVDPTNDVYSISTAGSDFYQAINGLVERIKQIPRRITNPSCGSNWKGTSGTFSVDQYVESSNMNYYRIAPNYFFGDGKRTVRIRGSGFGNLNVCNTREFSTSQTNNSDSNCQAITSTKEIVYDISGSCKGHDVMNSCPPQYFSVKATEQTQTPYKCTDAFCRFPDDIKFTVSVEGFGCENSSARLSNHMMISIVIIGYVIALTLRIYK